jgi:hypothetical protein
MFVLSIANDANDMTTLQIIAPVLPEHKSELNIYCTSGIIYDSRHMPISEHIAKSNGYANLIEISTVILKSEPELQNEFDTLFLSGNDMGMVEFLATQ